MSVTQRLACNRFVTDEDQPHIHINQDVAAASGAGPIIMAVCPAHVYSQNADGTIGVEYAACCECGACLAVAPPGSLEWHYPRAGYGIQFREG